MQVRGSLRKLVFSALVIGAAGALSGCVVNGGGYHDDDYHDYPPSRPNHGYRHSYGGGPTLIFDSGLGLYALYGYPDYYYYDGFYYRWHGGYWNRSRYWNRRWERCDSRYWPRPVYYVNNNYYVKGRRPRHDWDRDGRHERGDRDQRGDREAGPGQRQRIERLQRDLERHEPLGSDIDAVIAALPAIQPIGLRCRRPALTAPADGNF